jgi:hypothetical protein
MLSAGVVTDDSPACEVATQRRSRQSENDWEVMMPWCQYNFLQLHQQHHLIMNEMIDDVVMFFVFLSFPAPPSRSSFIYVLVASSTYMLLQKLLHAAVACLGKRQGWYPPLSL